MEPADQAEVGALNGGQPNLECFLDGKYEIKTGVLGGDTHGRLSQSSLGGTLSVANLHRAQ